ncbi:response regulator [Asaia bogorensis]|uniref:Response regulatory domain-containing protein n=1 Tax=Asaia bogorensis NBRC 16594 TaxID=1231624 RepID=A0AAN4R412_9PROT|nr:response regulator [Asaia bogorensis]GBQ81692.1 putative two component response regulator [Asaia bogorensis NBRC 16594]GEL54798.1 hypothetical protein ABO01nite_28050 [Asaia bogorensis NBRC 16594]
MPELLSDRSTILIVEDEILIRLMAEDHFADAGYTVLSAGSVDEAVDHLERKSDIRFAFIDVSLDTPFAGADLATTICDRWPTLKIIVTSARPPDGINLPQQAIFMPKPYDLSQVMQALDVMA